MAEMYHNLKIALAQSGLVHIWEYSKKYGSFSVLQSRQD